jgi:hypothetical protein
MHSALENINGSVVRHQVPSYAGAFIVFDLDSFLDQFFGFEME